MGTYAALTVSVLLSLTYAWADPDRNEDGAFTDAAGNLVHNGDFETVSSDCPPTGWTMWGAQNYKFPALLTSKIVKFLTKILGKRYVTRCSQRS